MEKQQPKIVGKICDHCGYNWEPRVREPKACPRCKSRLDYYKIIEIRGI